MSTAILLLSCPDRRGLVASLANFIADHGGNIIHADHHHDAEQQLFLSRLEWELEGFRIPRGEIAQAFSPLGESIQADWSLEFSDVRKRIAIWVSRENHCLLDLLWRQESGDLPCEVPLVISNHDYLRPIADQHQVDFHHIPVSSENREEAEHRQLDLMDQYQIDLIVLARYMQILSANLLDSSPTVINIHHSFLPAFPGAQPYRQAFDRGVKIIGATAHYATPDLDQGPIIDQDVARVSHRDGVKDLMRRGRDLERSVLARAVRAHLESRVLRYRNRTVVLA